MRLDKLLSHAHGLTRSTAQRAIRSGRIQLASEVVRDPARQVDPAEPITFDGKTLFAPSGPRYFMLHKPAGYLSTTEDGGHPLALDLLTPADRYGLHSAGRLDLDTTGLLLLTDDGQWSHRITSPRHHCAKDYRLQLAEPIADEALDQLRQGVLLRGEEQPTRPAEVERLGSAELRLTIFEGRYHQVKRMVAAVGNRVVTLHRERIGPLRLDPTLAPGGYRPLTAEEIAAF